LVGDIVYQKVGSLSGGERSRAALAKLVAVGCNVLVLDEPTNHLDLWACEALEDALKAFDGTVLVVSHDRYFLNQVCDPLLVLDGKGGSQLLHGNYDTHQMMRAQQEAARKEKEAAAEKRRAASRPAPAAAASPSKGKKKRKFPYRKPEELEAEIALAEEELAGLEKAMADPDLYRDGEKVKRTTARFEEAKAQIARLYEHWEEAVELG
ncbi:MAG: ATP-binding cassette domain-containing protein, partial [Gemmataceae bacterium]|nr:ATP-binding cassette domain-containing protein [Gemmataceae bacterium]